MKKCKDGRKSNVIMPWAKDVVANKRVYVDLPADTTIVKSTDKAHLLLVDGVERWCPKSICLIAGEDIKRIAKFIVDGWNKESDYE